MRFLPFPSLVLFEYFWFWFILVAVTNDINFRLALALLFLYYYLLSTKKSKTNRKIWNENEMSWNVRIYVGFCILLSPWNDVFILYFQHLPHHWGSPIQPQTILFILLKRMKFIFAATACIINLGSRSVSAEAIILLYW